MSDIRSFDEDEVVAMLEDEPAQQTDYIPTFALEVAEGAYGGAVDLIRVHHPCSYEHACRLKRAFDKMLRANRERFVHTRIVLEEETK
jgi:hypothetical protein